MKTNLLFTFIFLGQILSAQTFTEVMDTPFDGVQASSIAFSDIDGDNDQDLLITGWSDSTEISKLYTNDGLGNFTEVSGTSFEGVEFGSIAFSDVNGDNDQDVLITGSVGLTKMSKLYTNDGAGNFTKVIDTPFEDVTLSFIAFSDVDGDNDQDLLITGWNGSAISKLYINDGLGNFTEAADTPFQPLYNSSIAFSDVDGDNDQDVLIAGDGSSQISNLYTNDGLGNFTEVTSTPFEAVTYCSVAFSDVDGDNDLDALITGWGIISNTPTSKLYTNDGLGNFTEVMGTPFDGVWSSSIAFSDVDGDNDQDVLITGALNIAPFDPISKLYTNDGLGNFTEVMGTPFDGVFGGSIAFSDVDGDNDQDILITGQSNSGGRISKLYINESVVSIENRVDVNIFDLEGRLLKQHQEHIGVGEQTFSINISSLSKGAYTIQWDDGVRIGSQKFVVE